MQVVQIIHEFIGMLRFDPVPCQDMLREIFQVERDDYARTTANGGSKHMRIVRIRQNDSLRDRFILFDETVGDGRSHQRPCACQRRCVVWILDENSAYPFVMDTLGPACPESSGQRQPDQEVA
jgi:hypothetical protein